MKLYKYLFVALTGAMALTSCSDFLEAENKKNPDDADKNYGANPTAMLVSAYDAFRPMATEINMYEHGTDFYINPRGTDDVFSTFILTAEEGGVKTYYQNAYKAINYANGVIKYASETSNDAYEARFLRAWGYYLLTQQFGAVPYVTHYIQDSNRDYPRADVSEIYTGLIEDLTDLYNNSSLEPQDHNGHASKQAVAALLAKIYLAAGWDLNTTLNDAVKGTYTVTGTDYFTQAAAWAEKAINGVKLTMSFEDKWSPSNEGNAEEIFSIQYDRAGYPGAVSSGGHSLQNDYMAYYGNCTMTGMKGTSSGGTNHLSTKALRLFTKGDTRYKATFMTTFYNWDKQNWPTSGYYAYYNAKEEDKKDLPLAMKFYPHYVTKEEAEADLATLKEQFKPRSDYGVIIPSAAILDENKVITFTFDNNGNATAGEKSTLEFMQAGNNGVCVKKFDDPESENLTKENDYRDIVIFHVSDMYLVAAEAYLMAGNTTAALSKVNDVRTRAGLPALANFDAYKQEYDYTVSTAFGELNALDVILDERARELYAERQRWMDLRRTKQLVRYNIEFNRNINNVSDMSNARGEIKWYRPIPAEEINSNTSLTTADQNPGY